MSIQKCSPTLPLGTPTRFGKVGMIGFTGGERYYWLVGKSGVSMMPASVIEIHQQAAQQTAAPRLPGAGQKSD